MNKPYIPLALALALGAAGGYAFRGPRTAGVEREDAAIQTTRVEGPRESSSQAGSRNAGRERQSGQAEAGFARPFAPGGAAGFLESVAHNIDDDDDYAATIRMTQDCGRLDARGAEELAVECFRVARLADKGDPEIAKIFPHSDIPEQVLTQALVRLAALNAGKALEMMHHGEDDRISNSLLTAVFATVARENPNLAQQAISGLAEEDREAATQGYLAPLSQQDPAAAFKVLDGMPDSEDLRVRVVAQLAVKDPDAALAQAASRGQAQDFQCLDCLIDMSDEMRQRISEWMRGYNGPHADEIRTHALVGLAGSDTREAMNLYTSIADQLPDESRAECAAAVAKQLAAMGAPEANEWLTALPAGPLREATLASAVGSALSRFGRTNADFIGPIDGVPAATATNATNIVTCGLRSGSGAISRNNIDAVLNDPDRSAVQSDASSNNAAALLNEMEPSPEKEQLTLRYIANLQASDPSAATPWIDSLPDSSHKELLQRQNELKIALQQLADEGAGGEALSTGPLEGATIGSGQGALIGGAYGGAGDQPASNR
jgi:hypothetical protein